MDITEPLSKIVRAMGMRFMLNGRPLTIDEVLSPTGLLPAIAKRADQLSSLCLGYGIGVNFEDAESATMGVRAVFDDITPNTLRLLCMVDVLNELAKFTLKGDMTPLDQLMYD